MTKYEFDLARQRWATFDNAVSRLFMWGPICMIVYIAYLAIAVLAGKSTLAQFGLWIVADLKVNKIVSHLVTTGFGLGGITFGYRERRLRRENIKRLSDQQIELEKLIDPRRSSSRLTREGRTRPGDRV